MATSGIAIQSVQAQCPGCGTDPGDAIVTKLNDKANQLDPLPPDCQTCG